MSVQIVADIGSCHVGNKDYALEAIAVAKEIGVDVLKFQMFPNEIRYIESGNVSLPSSWWPDLVRFAKHAEMQITSSVFDERSLELVMNSEVPFIKFSYSMRNRTDMMMACLRRGHTVMVSSDVIDIRLLQSTFRKDIESGKFKILYCIPYYPVPYNVDFTGIFELGFHGFSDHTMGVHQTQMAIGAGAGIIEKHMTLDHNDINCPDNQFALKPGEMQKLIEIKNKTELRGLVETKGGKK